MNKKQMKNLIIIALALVVVVVLSFTLKSTKLVA